MDARDFTADEIAEINSYVINQVPQSILPQLFILTEEPIKKTKAFNAIFRILEASRDFAETPETTKKITKFLSEFNDIYDKMYINYVQYEAASYNKLRFSKKIIHMYKIPETNRLVNKLINSFLVFAEKQVLLETEKVTGVNMDIEEGVELHKKLSMKI